MTDKRLQVPLGLTGRRLAIKYYPLWILVSVLLSEALSMINMRQGVQISFRSIFFFSQIETIGIFLFVSGLLYTLKPNSYLFRLFIVIVGMMMAVLGFSYLFSEIFYETSVVPLKYLLFFSQSFFAALGSGIYIIWFFFLEERLWRLETHLKEEEQKKLINEKKLIENRLRLLQAQIEPHFLFNTLTSIVSLDESDPEKARDMQLNLIRYLESSLPRNLNEVSTIEREADLIKAYLNIYKVRMGHRLHYRIEIEDDIKTTKYPPMIIQPIVENAVKHGLEPSVAGGVIHIKVHKKSDLIKWEILDTGLGISESSEPGMGISNVSERLKALYGKRGKITLEEQKPSGLKVTIEIPYEKS